MGRLNDSITVLTLAVSAGVYLKPEYSIHDSRALTLVLIFATYAFSKILYILVLYPTFFTPLKAIPTPGNRHLFRGNGSSGLIDIPHEQIRNWVQDIPHDGLLRYYIIGQLERIIITNPKAASELLVTKAYDFVKPGTVRQNLSRIIGEGILLAENDEHKFQRKNLMPAFSYRHIKELYPIFWEKSAEMAKLMRRDLQAKASTGDNVLQVRTYASRATLDIIGLAGMGHDFDSLEKPDNKLYQSYRAIFTQQDTLSRILFMIGIFLGDMTLIHKIPTERNHAIVNGKAIVSDVARQMLREKKAKLEDPTADVGVDILSVALRSGHFEEENLVDQLMTFLAAGHETTSSALQWCVYALCKNPEVQERLREEVRAKLPSINDEDAESVTASAIDDLPYLHAVCNEVLRFHPSVLATVRIASKDTSLVGQPIPKGTFMVISPDLFNHMTELWGPDANEFNPERWMVPGQANTGGATSNYAFMSFIHGPHSCIGQGFSRAELACLLAALVGSFRFELKNPDAELELRLGATVSPLDGVLAKFTPLEGW